jgi:hypothetical protein
MSPRTAATVGIAALLVFSIPSEGTAQVFPDVPLSHPHREHIEALVSIGAIQGHPDGSFKPSNSVNRAEFLKIAYRAAGTRPAEGARGCFPDVGSGTWYEQYVCDAAKLNFVQGYNDGLFRPERTVSRAEGTKIALEVLDVSTPNLGEKDLLSLGFIDVSPYGWYARYIHRALSLGFYPPGFITETNFYPDVPLNRGEAAAIIHLTKERGPLAESLDREVEETKQREEQEDERADTGGSISVKKRGGDDYGQQEAGIVSLGSGKEGELEKAGDQDWFAIDLEEKQSLQITVRVLQGDPRLQCSVRLFQNDTIARESLESNVGGTRNQCMMTIFEPQILRAILTVGAGPSHTGNQYAVSVREVAALAPSPAPRTATLPFLTGSSRLQESYVFTLDRPSVIAVTVALDSMQAGGIRCSLNHLDEQGFSYESYTGYRDGHKCLLKVALSPGRQQVEISADASFTTRIEESSGDGNDGVREAKNLSPNTARTDSLQVNDLHDWFAFTLASAGTHTVNLSSTADLSCVILPAPDVDLLGFSAPACNISQDFPSGHYAVGAIRKNLAAQQQSYSIVLR